MALNNKESRQVRIERTLAGTGPVFQIGRLLAVTRGHKTLAQHLAEGEEIHREELNFPYPLPENFRLSLQSVALWGCPFCGSAHGSGIGVSRSVNVAGLEKNEFYYNPFTSQLFTVSATCLRKQDGLIERLAEAPKPEQSQKIKPVSPTKTARHSDAYLLRKSVAFLFACYCGLVAYSHLFYTTKPSRNAQSR